MAQEYENLLCRWLDEVWNQRRSETIDELFVKDGQGYGLETSRVYLVRPTMMGQYADPMSFDRFTKATYLRFRISAFDVLDSFHSGDKIVACCLVKGTHTGEGLAIPPTNKKVEFTGMCIVRVSDGKIREAWNNFDFMTMYQQLGVF